MCIMRRSSILHSTLGLWPSFKQILENNIKLQCCSRTIMGMVSTVVFLVGFGDKF